MPATLPGQLTVEKTPSYFVTKSAPRRIFNMSSSVRLIVVVRDPVTRAVSDYTQALAKQRSPGPPRPFADLAFLHRDGPVATSWGAVRIGIYARHLERWLRFFPRESFHFVSGERLISDPRSELEAVEDFLGLRRFVSDDMFDFSSAKGFPCLRRRRRGIAGQEILGGSLLGAQGVNVTGEGTQPRCLGKTKGRRHPPIDENVLQRLRRFYRPFNEKFYEMTGQNFSWP